MWGATLSWQHIVETVVPIAAAYLLALPLALEREATSEAHIGLRTMPLVSVGACAYLLVTRRLYEQGVYDANGLGRTVRAVMTGVGFIGGGAIVKHAREVRGLATGAGVWTAGAIGASVAHRYYEIAIVLALANAIVLYMPYWLSRVVRPRERDR